MGRATFIIAGRPYAISCDDGEEAHVTALAAHLDERAAAIAEAVGEVSEARLLVMTGLAVADEKEEALARAREEGKAQGQAAAEAAFETRFAPALEALADRIESIAARLESE